MSAPIRIVLVDTSHPGNIGASARAMKNMGIESLVLVRPKSPADPEAAARAAGAADVLARARVVATVDELGDVALGLLTKFAFGETAKYRLVGCGISNFAGEEPEEEGEKSQETLF